MHFLILGIKSTGTCEITGRGSEVLLVKVDDDPVAELSPRALLGLIRFRARQEAKANGEFAPGEAGNEK